MAVAAPPRPPRPEDPQALFEDARRHRRQRRLRFLGMLLAVVAAGVGAYAVLGGNTKHAPAGSAQAAAADRERTVVLLVDVSGSMRSTDIGRQRLHAAVSGMHTFLDRLPDEVEVGLVTFSEGANVVQEPTRDRQLVRAALGRLQPKTAGTNLGQGLATAVNLTVHSLRREGVRRMPGHRLPAAIVLESDGAQNLGALSPLAAAGRAKAAGIRVDGIALGTPGGVVHQAMATGYATIRVPPDPLSVELIAKVTGGKAFRAASAARVDAIYRELGSTIGR